MVIGKTLTRRMAIFALYAGLALGGAANAQDRFIVMASTTSTDQSGLFAHLLPAFKQAKGIDVRVVALGTGQALDSGRRGDADVVLVQGETRLFNQYGVIVVNPAKHPHTITALAQAFADWVVSPAGQATVASYKIGGEQLFFANAGAK